MSREFFAAADTVSAPSLLEGGPAPQKVRNPWPRNFHLRKSFWRTSNLRANPLAAIQSDANLEFQRIHEEKLSAAGRIRSRSPGVSSRLLARQLWQDLRQGDAG